MARPPPPPCSRVPFPQPVIGRGPAGDQNAGVTEPADPTSDARPLTAEFYQRVLDQIPTPIVVVDRAGTIVYGNRIISETSGLRLEEARGRTIMEFIHADDVPWAIDAFLALSEAGRDDSPWASEPWAPVPMRVVDTSGRSLHVEVTGANSLHDDIIDGFIYEVRHGAEPHMLRNVLTGLAAGRPVDELSQIVAEMIAAPPIRLEVVIADVGDGPARIVGVAGERLTAVLGSLDIDRAPWLTAGEQPSQLEVHDLDEPYRSLLADAGFADWFHVAVGDHAGGTAYRLAALTPYHHVPATGILHRLARATELLGVIRIRATNDALLARRARHDTLTELPNRAGLAAALDGDTPPTAVLFVDLDGFKPVNDQHGHAAGDHVLRAAAQRVQRAVRPGDVVARVGGDEFVVVLPAVDASQRLEATVRSIADRILRELTRPIEVNGVEIHISASIGVAIAPLGSDVDALVAAADAAMYEVKRAGGSGHRITVVSPVT